MNEIQQGADLSIGLTVEQDGSAVDLSAYAGILVFLINSKGVVLEKYSKTSQTGYESMDLTNDDEGKITINLDRAKTKLCPPGAVHAEVKLCETLTGFEASKFVTVASNVEVGHCVKTVSKSQDNFGS
jgi:hypothetical protein